MLLSSALLVAVLVDVFFGEPRKYHPLAGFGRVANALEQKMNRFRRAWLSRLSGVCAWLILLIPPLALGLLLTRLADGWFWLFAVFALYFAIAYRSLRQHILAIHRPLQRGDIVAARQALALIVSRDTGQLDAQGVRKAAIESCLENGSDGVFAPLFWYVFFGPVGAIMYRLMNTLDAMWGYKHTRFLHFGWFAARMDDLANWLPARLVAASYCLLGNARLGVHAWRTQAPLCLSPNAGPVMAAGAGALNIALGGPAVYQQQTLQKPHLGTANPASNADLLRALRLVRNTLVLWVLCGVILSAVVAGIGGVL